MNTEPEGSKIGEISKESFECDVISWKIPNISQNTESTEWQSPQFSYKKATWILKMSPSSTRFGRSFTVAIERLHSEIPAHNFFYSIFLKSHREMMFGPSFETLHIRSNFKKMELYCQHWCASWYQLYHSDRYRRNDTVTLILEIVTKKNAVIGVDCDTDSSETDLSTKFTNHEGYLKSVGELSTESFDVEVVAWKISKINSIPAEVDNSVQSPTFSFAGASWNLKLFVNGQAKFKTEDRIDVVIERLDSEIQKHSILYRCSVESYEENESLENYYDNWDDDDIINGFIADSNNTLENILNIMSYKDLLNLFDSSRQLGTVVMMFEFRIPKNHATALDNPTEWLQSVIESTEKTSVSEPTSCASTCEESTDEISVPEPTSCASTSKGCKRDISKTTWRSMSGGIIRESVECEVITWKIPNASSLVLEGKSYFKSSSFSYNGAQWILKLHVELNEMNVAIERLHSQIPEHNLFIKIHFKKIFYSGYGNDGDLSGSGSFFFDANHSQREMVLKHLENFLYIYKHFRYWNTFILVCEFYTKKNAIIDFGYKAKSLERDFSFGFGALSSNTPTDLSFGSPVATTSNGFGFGALSSNTPTDLSFGSPVATTSNDFPFENLHRDFRELYLKREDCDAILRVKDEEFPVHRLILKARSPVFASTFGNDMKEKSSGIIDIEDCDPSSFSDFLRFLYCGSVENLSTENVFSLFQAADKYDVRDLRSGCLKFIQKNLSVDTFCDTMSLAVRHSEKELIELSTDFFARNFQKIIVTVQWQYFLLENPIQGNEIFIKALVNDNK